MTPQEKALELKEQFDGYICYALTAVDEIIEALDLINEKYNKFGLEFYVKVKEELEKL